MTNIVNLRQARKQKTREAAKAEADANAARHGRSKAERDSEAMARKLSNRRLDGHKRDGD